MRAGQARQKIDLDMLAPLGRQRQRREDEGRDKDLGHLEGAPQAARSGNSVRRRRSP
jgi:hypothetical protein